MHFKNKHRYCSQFKWFIIALLIWSGQYSCIKVQLLFERESHKYVTQWFVPTAVLTLVSFASFWMKPKANRLKLLLVLLVVLYLHTIYINNKASTRVPYSTSNDRWLCACILFVVTTLVELIVVKVVDNLTNQKNGIDDNGKSNFNDKALTVI